MSQLAIQVRAQIQHWKARSPINTWPQGFVHDVVLDTLTPALSDQDLETLTARATASNLRALGWTGSRGSQKSGPKQTLGSFYTSILHRVCEKHGRASVLLGDPANRVHIRGVKDDPIIKAFFLTCVADLTKDLLGMQLPITPFPAAPVQPAVTVTEVTLAELAKFGQKFIGDTVKIVG